MNNHCVANRKIDSLENGFEVISYGESLFDSFKNYQELHHEIIKLFNEDAINTWGKNLISNIIYDDAYGGILKYFMSGLKQQEYGEVFTPKWLVNEILDKFEKHDPEFFKNPNHTVIDFAAGVGNILIEIIDRFYKGTRSLYSSDEECMKHIIEHQIYAVEIQPNNYMILCKALDVNNLCPDNPHFVCADADGFDFWDIDYFDMVFINPPYSTTTKKITGKNFFSELFQKFSYLSHNISKRYVMNIIPARCLYKQDDFSKELIYHTGMVNITTFMNYKNCFDAAVSGGVIYYILDKKYNNHYNLSVEEVGYDSVRKSGIRKVQEYDGYYPRTLTGCNIINKVKKISNKFFSDVAYARNLFKLSSSYHYEAKDINLNTVYKILSGKNRVEYIDKEKINRYLDVIDNYKFVICGASSSGLTANKNGKIKIIISPTIVDKNVLFIDSFMCLYISKDRKIIENVEKYFSTKFSQYLLLQGLPSHNICKERFCFVPVVDFSEEWTDEKLFEKYQLSDEEIDEILSTIA